MISRSLNKNNDWILSGGRFKLTSDGAQVLQRVKERLQLYLGEWFLQITEGTPWYQEIFTKPADLVKIESILKTRILTTPGVESLTSFEMNYPDPRTRKLIVSFEAKTTYDTIIADEVTINE